MTEVAFHVNLPDKLAYACRLLRKAYQSTLLGATDASAGMSGGAAGAVIGVIGPAETLRALDMALWQFSVPDFIPHCAAIAPAHMLAASPIVLAATCAALPRQQGMLVHLGQQVPEGFECFARLIELVSADESDRAAARQRFKHYRDRGYPMQIHDRASRP